MAATDITSNKDFDVKLDNTFHTPFYYKAKLWDIGKNTGLGTQFAHPLIDINVGEAWCGLIIVVQTTFVGVGATVTFEEAGGDAVTGAVLVANLAAGAVLEPPMHTVAATGQPVDGILAAYAHTTASTITCTPATADFTAGKALVLARFLKSLDTILA